LLDLSGQVSLGSDECPNIGATTDQLAQRVAAERARRAHQQNLSCHFLPVHFGQCQSALTLIACHSAPGRRGTPWQDLVRRLFLWQWRSGVAPPVLL
jgi:hypothetical protein